MIEIELPWPPSVNTYYRTTAIKGRGQITLISKRGRQYRKDAIQCCKEQGVEGINIDSRLAVEIDAYPPDRRKRDLDNIFKAILDSLTHANVWLDDEQIDDLRVVRKEKVKFGKAVVRIHEIIKIMREV